MGKSSPSLCSNVILQCHYHSSLQVGTSTEHPSLFWLVIFQSTCNLSLARLRVPTRRWRVRCHSKAVDRGSKLPHELNRMAPSGGLDGPTYLSCPKILLSPTVDGIRFHPSPNFKHRDTYFARLSLFKRLSMSLVKYRLFP